MSDFLAACDKPQVAQSLSELGAQHRPSKFGYMGRRRPFTHAQFDTIYPLFLEELRTKEFKLLEKQQEMDDKKWEQRMAAQKAVEADLRKELAAAKAHAASAA